MFRLDGKTAVVTGAGSGIGRDVALVYARQGAHVVVADLNAGAAAAVVREIEAAGGAATARALDVSDEASVREVLEGELPGGSNRLDVLVNNAGVGHVGSVLETTLADWQRVMSVNATGVFLCARSAVDRMLKQDPVGGAIVNLASVAGMIGVEKRFPYCASKGAVVQITRSIAVDFAGQGIRCNAICPGTVHTPFVEGFLAKYYPDTTDDVRRQLHARQPVGRMGRPDEIAHAALYLASDEAAFVTGSLLVIDGGWTAK
jgi:NAD(P)-dependent dehydrogenase (short-subunit alcohol dehydrogenase family)